MTRDVTIKIRVTAKEAAAYRRAAKAQGRTLSSWLRWLATHSSTMPGVSLRWTR